LGKTKSLTEEIITRIPSRKLSDEAININKREIKVIY
tara:strand:+ start:28900 stop:29010 length:111 start_codon:yes stop_codon:yes gene_type:complete